MVTHTIVPSFIKFKSIKAMNITVLGEAKFESPIGHSISDSLLIPENIVIDPTSTAKEELVFELAGPRSKLFFDAKHTHVQALLPVVAFVPV